MRMRTYVCAAVMSKTDADLIRQLRLKSGKCLSSGCERCERSLVGVAAEIGVASFVGNTISHLVWTSSKKKKKALKYNTNSLETLSKDFC